MGTFMALSANHDDLAIADAAMSGADTHTVPTVFFEDYQLISKAFTQYEAKQDEAALETLRGIGLRSPFREWRLFLRGLIAWAAGDFVKTKENWQRLTPKKIPAKLSYPLLLEIDEGAFPLIPQEEQNWAQAVVIQTPKPPLLKELKALVAGMQQKTSVGRNFGSFKGQIEEIAKKLKTQMPEVFPYFQKSMYFEFLSSGAPGDIQTFRQTLGELPDDPDLQRLRANIHSNVGNPADAFRHWQAYEAWLSTKPNFFPESLLPRMRAICWHQMAIQFFTLDIPEENIFAMYGFQQPNAQLKPSGIECLKKSMLYAPDWFKPAELLALKYTMANQKYEATLVLQYFTDRNTENVEALQLLGNLQFDTKDYEKAYLTKRKYYHLNPLDPKATSDFRVSSLVHFICRFQKAPLETVVEEIEAHIRAYPKLSSGLYAVLSVVAMKDKNTDIATSHWNKAVDNMTETESVLPLRFIAKVVSTQLPLKPAVKKIVRSEYERTLQGNNTPVEMAALWNINAVFSKTGLSYVGMKKTSSEILKRCLELLDNNQNSIDLENMATLLIPTDLPPAERKLYEKILDTCMSIDTHNPKLMLQNYLYANSLKKDTPRLYRAENQLHIALKLASNSAEKRYQDLLPQLQDLIKSTRSTYFMNPFGGF